MVSLRCIILSALTLILFACQTKPDRKKLRQLINLTSSAIEKEFCTIQTNEDSNLDSEKIEILLSELGYDCCSLYEKAKDEIEDSVLVLTKRKTLEVQTLYYDFAKRTRELKTWNYPNASDKRVKLEDRIYLQTSGFD